MNGWDMLVGKRVKALYMHSDKTVLRLDLFGAKPVYLTATGDCCSQSWFEHVEGLAYLVGATVAIVEMREMPEQTEHDGDCIQYYGWSIKTDKGQCELEMRNSSNGYYGGECEIGNEPCHEYEGKLAKVTEDF